MNKNLKILMIPLFWIIFAIGLQHIILDYGYTYVEQVSPGNSCTERAVEGWKDNRPVYVFCEKRRDYVLLDYIYGLDEQLELVASDLKKSSEESISSLADPESFSQQMDLLVEKYEKATAAYRTLRNIKLTLRVLLSTLLFLLFFFLERKIRPLSFPRSYPRIFGLLIALISIAPFAYFGWEVVGASVSGSCGLAGCFDPSPILWGGVGFIAGPIWGYFHGKRGLKN